MSGRPSQNAQQMFNSLKAMFPHIDLSIINEQLSFSQNLQNIISQLGTPARSQTYSSIFNMKQAVDKQQLKIQKSLVNQEDVLGNITNRTLRRQKKEKLQNKFAIDSIEEQSGESKCQSNYCWHNQENMFSQPKHQEYMAKNIEQIGDIIQQIWELNSENMKDWFHH